MNTTLPPPGSEIGFQDLDPADGVYFHADDMGATPTLTGRLLDSWDKGLLDGFSVFGDCDHPGVIAPRLQAYPDRHARVAVHLNLGDGRPLTPISQVTRLVDRSGFFNTGLFGMLNRHHLGSSALERNRLLSEVGREWRAQIENVIEMIKPRSLAALDGHLHIHMAPYLFRLAVKLAKEYNISEIRNVREPFYLSRDIRECRSKRFLINCVKRGVLSRFASGNARFAEAEGLRSPDRVLGVLYSGRMSRANIGAGIAASVKQGARRIEVLVHVGRADASELSRWDGNRARASFAMSSRRDAEYEELTRIHAERLAYWDERRAS